ncbi:hypothetical protein B0A50_08717 [Salinomyces thailandicus]|uniref:Uncharacterized protein n=1 Tax=Salinomyces thailandicus TaxID=706561 RepID=A0A4U0TJ85_9PEZI|nr:hypothetical protein B0A50_08717 [Salinomyces thailandica]
MTDLLPAQQPPPPPQSTQDTTTTGESNDVGVTVSCYPPLGQATQIPRHRSSVRFAVLLETPTSSVNDHLEVSLWHNHHGQHDWSELPLTRVKEFKDVLLLGRPEDSKSTSTWFTGELSGSPKHGQAVSFTVKFKTSSSEGWQWVKDQHAVPDGELQYQTMDWAKHPTHELEQFFESTSSDIVVTSERPDTDDTVLYSLTCPVQASQGDDSGYQHHRLGKAKHCSRWFALVRLWSPWLAPRHGKKTFVLDKDGVLLSFLRSDGMHVVVLGISGIDDVLTTFIHDEEGNVIIKSRNDRPETGTGRVVVAVADSFEVANAAVMYHARKVVGPYAPSTATDGREAQTQQDEKVKPEWMEEWYDGLTYCTWNGLGQALTADKIYDALESLSKNNIDISTLTIDDNWQSLSQGETQFQRAWTSFEATPDGFPMGLKAFTSEVRKRHPNIKHVAVWHALLGYWGGVAPESDLAKKYRTAVVDKEPGVAGGTFTVVTADDAHRLYDDFYAFLTNAGIDAVKTDAQFFLDLLLHAPDRRALTPAYHAAWTTAHLRHLSARATACMSQTPPLLSTHLPTTSGPRIPLRNSDDFFPAIPASHPWHLFCNAHNALFTQHLNVLPDWDMFQTAHQWAHYHAAARCLSGGPISITDAPGEHDLALIGQMTARTVRGRTVVLRPSNVGKAADAYTSYDDSAAALLRISTYVGMARTGMGILGCFNVSGREISEIVPLAAFPGTESGGEYVVASFRTNKFSPVLSAADHPTMDTDTNTNNSPSLLSLRLPPGGKGWDILTAHPVHTFPRPDSRTPDLRVAILGLRDKMTGAAALNTYSVRLEDSANHRVRVNVSLKALGTLGLWLSGLKSGVGVEGLMVMIMGRAVPGGCVGLKQVGGGGDAGAEDDKGVLEIDVERAWEEMGLDAGWGNEIGVEVFLP